MANTKSEKELRPVNMTGYLRIYVCFKDMQKDEFSWPNNVPIPLYLTDDIKHCPAAQIASRRLTALMLLWIR